MEKVEVVIQPSLYAPQKVLLITVEGQEIVRQFLQDKVAEVLEDWINTRVRKKLKPSRQIKRWTKEEIERESFDKKADRCKEAVKELAAYRKDLTDRFNKILAIKEENEIIPCRYIDDCPYKDIPFHEIPSDCSEECPGYSADE